MTLQLLRHSLASRPQHFSPFFVLGDPDPETSIELCLAAVEAGASMLELGIPYSDPVADGPAIQAASRRARAAGTNMDCALHLIQEIASSARVPLNLLVYGNLVHARGFERFVRECAEASASSLLVPDIPLEEASELRNACSRNDLGLVQLVGPRTSPERARELARNASAFCYLTGRQGVTGVTEAGVPQKSGRFRAAEFGPLAFGFGLKTRADVQMAFDRGANIAIVGSALALQIQELHENSARASAISDRIRHIVHLLASPSNAHSSVQETS